MSTTLNGNATAYTLTQLLAASLVVPTNGDNVDAAALIAAAQKIVDYAASAGALINANSVPAALRGYATVASLKAFGAMADGDVRTIRGGTYTSGILRGVGLFVYDIASTAPETSIPDLPEAYLVISPNSGVGRWINVAAGVGWKIDGPPQFYPVPYQRFSHWYGVGDGGDFTPYNDPGGFGGTPVLFNAFLGSQTTMHLDFDLCVKSGSLNDQFTFRLEVSVAGGAWAAIPGSTKFIGGVGTNNTNIALHLGGRYIANTSASHSFRVAIDYPDSAVISIFQKWSARGTSYSPTLSDRHPHAARRFPASRPRARPPPSAHRGRPRHRRPSPRGARVDGGAGGRLGHRGQRARGGG